jgi:hypothetical protein
MARTRITQHEVGMLRNASRRSSRTLYLWDTEFRSLGLRTASGGPCAWLVLKWVGGRRGKLERVVIGHYPPMTIEEARKQARIMRPRSGKMRPAAAPSGSSC